MTELDAVDIAMLEVLQSDGRVTNAELAERVSLSQSACLRRLRRLEQSGVIDRYVAMVHPGKVGLPTSVFVEISLASQREEVLDEFEAAIMQTPEVMECHLMAGDGDYLVKVQCADVADYERVHRQYLAVLPGVTRLKTSFSLRTVLSTTAVDLTRT